MTGQELQESPGAEPRFFYGYIIVSLAFLVLMMLGGSMFTFGVFFKPLSGDFGWTRALTSGAFSMYWIMFGLLSIIMGRLTDKLGPRVVVTICGLFIGLGYLLMSQISAAWQLYLLYGVIIGSGMGSGFVPQLSTVARWFVKRRGLLTGITIAGIGFGTMIVPPVANWLISNYGWRTSYAIIGFIALVVIILAAQFLRRDPSQKGLVPYGSGELKKSASDLRDQGFSFREAIKTRQFWLLCAAGFFFVLSQQAIMVHVVPHAIGLGISTILAANILAIIGGLSVAGRISMGSSIDRIGNKSVLVISLFLATAALAWILAAREIWMLYLFAVVFGFAWGGISTMLSPMVAELFGLSSHGVLLGAVIFSMNIGGALGPVLAGGIFDVRGSYDWAFLACTIICAIGLVLSTLLKPTKKNESV
jgi:MFS family permease